MCSSTPPIRESDTDVALTRLRRAYAVVGFALAVSTAVVLVGGLVVERALGPDSCEAVDDSSHGVAVWRWAPPGMQCSYQSATNSSYVIIVEPSWARVGALAVSVVLGLLSMSLLLEGRPPRRR